MSHELDDHFANSEIDTYDFTSAEVEDQKGYEYLDGEWAPKHPLHPQPDDDRKGCELIDGVWVEKSMSNVAGLVGSNILFAIKSSVRANRLGLVMTETAMYQLDPEKPRHWRRPDLSFIRYGRLPNDKLPEGRITIAPDLAVEVISPNDKADELETKLTEYLQAQTRLMWVVYIPTRHVWAYRPDGTARLYRETDTLPGEDVLAGFSVPVAELFEGV